MMPVAKLEASPVAPGVTSALPWLAFILLFVVALMQWPGVFLLDDAYITLGNARALIEGDDPVYGTSPFAGATSAVHLVGVALLGLVLPLPTASAAVGAFAFVIYAAGLRALAISAGCRGMMVAVCVFIGLFIGYQLLHYLNGLETGLAMATVAWALALRDSRWLPLLCGLMPFVRPELAMLAAPLFFRFVWISREVTRSLGIALAAAFPFAALYVMETGLPFPNTAGAKVAFFAEIHLPFLRRLGLAAASIGASGLWPLAIGLLVLRRIPGGWCVGVFVTGCLAIATVTFPGSLFHNSFRYLAPLVPALCYPVFALLASSPWRSFLAATLSVWTVVTLCLSLGVEADALALARERHQAAIYVRDRLPEGAVVLVHDAGEVAWLRPAARLVDVVGLKTPTSTAAHRQFTREACAWGKALTTIALKAQATHAVVLEDQGFWACVGESLRQDGWDLTPLKPAGAGTAYAIYRISRPDRGG